MHSVRNTDQEGPDAPWPTQSSAPDENLSYEQQPDIPRLPLPAFGQRPQRLKQLIIQPPPASIWRVKRAARAHLVVQDDLDTFDSLLATLRRNIPALAQEQCRCPAHERVLVVQACHDILPRLPRHIPLLVEQAPCHLSNGIVPEKVLSRYRFPDVF